MWFKRNNRSGVDQTAGKIFMEYCSTLADSAGLTTKVEIEFWIRKRLRLFILYPRSVYDDKSIPEDAF